MATIKLSDSAPDEAVHFSFVGAEFDLEGSGTYETDSPEAIDNAQAHPWLTVEVDHAGDADPRPEDAEDYDPNDPHDNPEADHLSRFASQETKDEAAANDAAIREAAYPSTAVEGQHDQTPEVEVVSRPKPVTIVPPAGPVETTTPEEPKN